MKKIQTIFDRNWEEDRKCIDKLIVDAEDLYDCFATEKIDGTNIRVTIRSGKVMRVEKRRNPSKQQKAEGIVEPWYVDASRQENQDKWIFDAVDSTDFSEIKDGEWSAEAFGENIQGNPLQLKGNQVFVFSCKEQLKKITFKTRPTSFQELKAHLKELKSFFNPEVGIEGIVWHNLHYDDMYKIKVKDFTY